MSAEELPVNPAQAAEPGSRTDERPQGLTLVSVSRDGRRMLFVDAAGREFAVDIDDRLRAALPAGSPRRSEPSVNNAANNPPSSLRPRDIQTRIRGGESAEEVAAAAGTTVERIMPFAAPVLAEREHMAERAQKASVRRRAGDPAGTARTLGDAVAAHLRTVNLLPDDAVDWDSYRRTDGRWTLTAVFDAPGRAGVAEFTFDPQGFYVSLDNDDARWLIGEAVEVVSDVPPLVDDLEAARLRRQQPPAETVQPAPAEASVEVPDEPEVSPTEDTVETPLEVETPVEAYLFDDPVEQPTRKQRETKPDQAKPDQKATAEPQTEPESSGEPEQPRPARRSSRRKRASVPSWDEIMFGGGKSE